MPTVLVLVHGWSVTSKDTYGRLPEALAAQAAAAGLDIELRDIHLGRYISFHDEVTVDDIALALEHAVRTDLAGVRQFSCITHSTGGPVVRRWVDLHYGAERLADCPLRHLIMLAPANHGSALAVLGKGRVGRMQAWFGGIEPGQRVLDWLCLGSPESWDLQDRFTHYSLEGTQFFPFVLSGESIDRKFYDFINSYLDEAGSDGVVRLAGANLNYTFFRLEQTAERFDGAGAAYRLRARPRQKARPPATGFGVIPAASHSGKDLGIMRSVTATNAAAKPVVGEILQCLRVATRAGYDARVRELEQLTTATQLANASQHGGRVRRFVMFIFRISDDRGQPLGDYDLLLLGDGFRPECLPRGFFIDRQRNARSHALVYYLDYDVLACATDLGFRVIARPVYSEPGGPPAECFAGYRAAEFRFTGRQLAQLLRPNETVYVDIVLNRMVDTETLRLEPLDAGRGSFKGTAPAGPVG